MKKLIVAFVCLPLLASSTAAKKLVNVPITIITDADSEKPLLTSDSLQLEVVPGNAGEALFRGDGLQWLSLAGEWTVSCKALTVLLMEGSNKHALATRRERKRVLWSHAGGKLR